MSCHLGEFFNSVKIISWFLRRYVNHLLNTFLAILFYFRVINDVLKLSLCYLFRYLENTSYGHWFIQFIYLYSIRNHTKTFVNCHTLAVAFWLSLNVSFLTLPLFMSIFIFPLEYSTKLIRSLHPFLVTVSKENHLTKRWRVVCYGV